MKKNYYKLIFTLSVFGLCNRCFGQQTDYQKKRLAIDSIVAKDMAEKQNKKKWLCGNIDSSVIVNTGVKDPYNPPISNEIKVIEIQTYESPKPKQKSIKTSN